MNKKSSLHKGPGRRVLFSGYAPVHTLCFLPVYEELKNDPRLDIFFSGGFRTRDEDGFHYDLEGFYEPMGIDPDQILPLDEALSQPFDVAICAHTSDTMIPDDVGRSIQIFHGVSFKNFAVREKVLKYDYLCLSGRYHAERFRDQGLIREGGSSCLVTGFAKTDALLAAGSLRDAYLTQLGMDPSRPTILFAPTGGKYNALEDGGLERIQAIKAEGCWNLLLKPHDHPKRPIDRAALEALESSDFRLVRDIDVIPLLKVADLLITDASSVAMEYTLLDRPIVFADVPRLFKNVRKRGAPLDLKTHGRNIGPIAEGPGQLVEAIRSSLANPEEFHRQRRSVATDVFYRPGGAAQRVADVILHAAGCLASLPPEIEVLRP